MASGIAGERAGLIDRAVGREHVHDVGATTEGADGQAAADDFAERGEVRRDSVQFLHAAFGDAEAGHDFVEDEQRAVFCGDIAQQFRKPRLARMRPALAG